MIRLIFALMIPAGFTFAVPSLSSAVISDRVSLTVPVGTWTVGGREVKILTGDRFFVRGAGTHAVVDEPMQLSPKKPAGFWIGTKLKGPRTYGPINALDSLRTDTLVVRREKNADPLLLGRDYLVSPPFALLGLGPDTDLTETNVVYASYQYQVHRLDSVVLMTDGRLQYLQGTPGTAAVAPPRMPSGSIRLLNVFRPYGATELRPEHLFFIEGSSECIETGTTVGRIPKTLRKLKNGEPVTIVCLGDSVTAGADIANHSDCYVDQFRVALQDKFSPEQINLRNISLGGSKSIQWLYDGNYKRLQKRPAHQCSFSKVLDAKPDLVTIEFVNDTALTEEELNWSYKKIMDELQAMGSEIILITPHFTHPTIMKAKGEPLRPSETRPYVQFLREFSEKNNLGLADASSRWEQSWKEGIPYITLLNNHYNHPSARGSRLFVQELMKCFKGERSDDKSNF